MGSLFVSDLDDTLLRMNTTFEFVRFVVNARGGSMVRVRWNALLGARSPLLFMQMSFHRAVGVDLARGVALGFLAGRTRRELETLGDEFVGKLTDEDFLLPALERWDKARREGSRMVLASSTIDPVTTALAQRLGGEGFSSRLEYEAGSCTGRLAFDLTGRKEEALKPLLDSAEHVTVMTDNFSDRRLVEMADHRILVLRSPRGRAKWDALDAEFLRWEPRP